MFKKQDVATDILVFVMLIFLFINQFMFMAAARIGDKEGLTARECLGANYAILLGLTIVLLVLSIVKGKKKI